MPPGDKEQSLILFEALGSALNPLSRLLLCTQSGRGLALTGPNLLPLPVRWSASLQRVLGNGAVIVKATTPANLDSGVSDVSHYHTSRGTWGTCTERQSTLGQKWTAPSVSRFSPDPGWVGSQGLGTEENGE